MLTLGKLCPNLNRLSLYYLKGASVLRMLDNFMGEEPFRKGVRNFLREFEYANAVTADLWRHLAETSTEKLPIGDIMDTWTKQMGYPVLSVSKIGQVGGIVLRDFI